MRRPFAITAVCTLGATAGLYTAVLFLSSRMWGVPPSLGERLAALGAVAVALLALWGLWRMRRWGVYLLAIALAARAGFALAAHQALTPAALAGPLVALLVGGIYLRRMT